MLAGLMTEQLEAENILFTPKVEKPTVLIEWACSDNSELGVQGTKLGIVVIRLTKRDTDLSTAAGLALALQKIEQNKGCHMHGSLPCTAWCSFQRLNEYLYGEQYTLDLDRRKSRSIRMLKNFIVAAKAIKKNGGTISFEWPDTAAGWKQDKTEQMIGGLELDLVIFLSRVYGWIHG